MGGPPPPFRTMSEVYQIFFFKVSPLSLNFKMFLWVQPVKQNKNSSFKKQNFIFDFLSGFKKKNFHTLTNWPADLKPSSISDDILTSKRP